MSPFFFGIRFFPEYDIPKKNGNSEKKRNPFFFGIRLISGTLFRGIHFVLYFSSFSDISIFWKFPKKIKNTNIRKRAKLQKGIWKTEK